ncbi:hypothetical protein [Brevibacillus laterosporus]|uniref:Uncharacterized protein n=1 Tax=Brevibacillus laterosporus TaxID=1465 RepID=A0AAP3DJL6_BRELA|nr:hypothetical protein [Brevibacillus laterosporus]MCR8982538.1 hypothetical protein [Brevibacillus laterosporus]MCZ0809694.1 hypothetical protein [Brevibacillus laterosporus]MCZ0828227.1 hypothetical protein [Brevibacillus laterosporus]MCZ0852249.1 hypothetical protein [Brevibacillus laterosporus]
MFIINYQLVLSESEIASLTYEEFIEEHNDDFLGLILFSFNEHEYGYYSEDATIHEFNLFEEWIILWFRMLNDAVLLLKKKGYAAIKTIEEPDNWIVFKNSNENVLIDFVLATDMIPNVIVTAVPLCGIYHVGWENEVINKSQFFSEIKTKTGDLIQKIERLNNNLAKSSVNFQRLKEAYLLAHF